MKNRLIAAVLAAALIAPVAGALEVGGSAPELMLSKVIKGDPVDKSLKDSGMITVVEFWATWCGPCRRSIPHLTELQAKYKDKNVRIIGITDETEELVRGFIEEQGEDMAYTVALDEDNKTWAAYAEPFGVKGIPHAFVVDESGTLLWHGHPMTGLDAVLTKVVAGDFDGEAARAQAKKDAIQEEMSASTMRLARDYLELAAEGRDTDRADEIGQQLLDSGYENPQFYNQFAWTLLNNEDLAYQNHAYMMSLAQHANELTNGESADVLDTLALAQYRTGAVEAATATQKKAIELCEDDALKEQLVTRLARYEQR